MLTHLNLAAVTLVTLALVAPAACLNYGGEENEIWSDEVPRELRALDRRPLLRCVSGSDCPRDQCSVMGMQRYSEPRCEALSGEGAPCRMYAEPENKTLNFPHATMQCDQVYLQMCPCAEGLVCEEATCRRARRPKRPQGLNRPQGDTNYWNTRRLH